MGTWLTVAGILTIATIYFIARVVSESSPLPRHLKRREAVKLVCVAIALAFVIGLAF